MKKRQSPIVNPKDYLMTRPAEPPLPTPLDPNSPEARGWPHDPKPTPERGQGDPQETNPSPAAVSRSA